MTMKDGVQEVANTALDTKDKLCMDMMDAGVSPRDALIASTVATKQHMQTIINAVLGTDAAGITHALSEVGKGKKPLS